MIIRIMFELQARGTSHLIYVASASDTWTRAPSFFAQSEGHVVRTLYDMYKKRQMLQTLFASCDKR